MRALIAALVVACLSAAARPEEAAPPPAPTLQASELVYDGGKVVRGVPLRHVFVLKNTGTTALSIAAKPGGGCPVTESDKVIHPGGVGKVTASLDTSHYKGVVTKTVQVRTNDPGTPPVVLQLKADVVSLIDVQPTETPVVRVRVGEVTPTELTLSATDGKRFDVLSLRADPSVDVAVRPDTGARARGRPKRPHGVPVATGSSRYLVTIAPKPGLRIGQTIATVTLTTNRAKAETVPIRAVLMVTGRVDVAPPALVARAGAEPLVLHAKVTKAGGDSLEIVDVGSDDPDFTVTSTPIAAGHEYDVAVRYTGKPGRGIVQSQIRVRTNEPGQETIVIPLTGAM